MTGRTLHDWLRVGVDISDGRSRCRGCGQRIAKGERRFWYLGQEYARKPNYFSWHPECFVKHSWTTWSGEVITGRDVVAKMIEVFLPLIIDREVAEPVIIALKLGRD